MTQLAPTLRGDGGEIIMASSFNETVKNAQEGIELLSPEQAKAALEGDSNAIILDVRDKDDLGITGIIKGTEHVSMGTLYFKADHGMPAEYQACSRDKGLQSKS